jgi:hypothetical protein
MQWRGPLGLQFSNPVGLIDLFPTVVHLATGLELPRGAEVDTSGLPLGGVSLMSQAGLNNVYTFSQYPR